MPKIDVKCLPVGEFRENCYLVVNAETLECLIVDPGEEGGPHRRGGRGVRPFWHSALCA